jgi:hypothetical protein
MVTRNVALSELQDLALASCDDQHLEALVAREVISSFLARDISVREIRGAYGVLLALGLVKAYQEKGGKVRAAMFEGTRTRDLLFRATRRGVAQLKRPRNVV